MFLSKCIDEQAVHDEQERESWNVKGIKAR
jgi:hypothetical protein